MTICHRHWRGAATGQRLRAQDPLPPHRGGGGEGALRGRDHEPWQACCTAGPSRGRGPRGRARAIAGHAGPGFRAVGLRDGRDMALRASLTPLLLDTHAWVWWLTRPERLTRGQRTAIDRVRRSAREPILVSIISC